MDLLSPDESKLDERMAQLELLRLFEDLLMAQNAARVENQYLDDTDAATGWDACGEKAAGDCRTPKPADLPCAPYNALRLGVR